MASDKLDPTPHWKIEDVIAHEIGIENNVSRNIVRLLNDDNTIPFIARYRKEKTNDMAVDKLQDVHAMYMELREVQGRIATVMKSIDKLGKLTKDVATSLKNSVSTSSVEHLYAPFKPGSKRSLAEKARELGLEPLAKEVIETAHVMNHQILSAINRKEEGLSDFDKVVAGVEHIVADIIAKDKDTMDEIRKLCKGHGITVHSKKSKASSNTEKGGKGKQDKVTGNKKTIDTHKFEQYFDWKISLQSIKPHQVLALNRGESKKVLSVKIEIADHIMFKFLSFCKKHWIKNNANDFCRRIVKNAIDQAYKRLIEPLMSRHLRAELSKTANKASVDVFASNLKRLLLTPPIRGHIVLGIDPGFKHGCKCAVTSPTGFVLHTDTVYIHGSKQQRECGRNRVVEIIQEHKCELIAIGNGTACRETETFFSDLIQNGPLKSASISYCIVNEDGASIYSVSDVAQKEMPAMDQNLRSAVSIARRLQDPLSELVKIEPKHIGVGMYQHDVPEKQMKTSLDQVVEECVSFVGVDLNFATPHLLRRVAGLSEGLAKKIIDWRGQHGAFTNRQQLNEIRGLGPKTFKQCAGFLKILPESTSMEQNKKAKIDDAGPVAVGQKRKATGSAGKSAAKKAKLDTSVNKLDMTIIHPESYNLAKQMMAWLHIPVEDIGKDYIRVKVKSYLEKHDVKVIAGDLNADIHTMKLIMEALQQPVGHDIREEFEKPLFKKGTTSIDDLKIGAVLTGCVRNMTHFGAFVDIGVQQDALIHTSQMREKVQLGDKVEVRILSVEKERKRIGLKLEKVL